MTELPKRRAMSRRDFLIASTVNVAALIAPARAAGLFQDARVRLGAAWNDPASHRIGILALQDGAMVPESSLEVPTRAHGLAFAADGSLFAVARRPGDWILRWRPGHADADWIWAEPGRAFNGHIAFSADGRRVFTSETDLDSGAGIIGVRDACTLAALAEWPSHGIDPHALLVEGDMLMVANGGVPTRPETGRVKRGLERMDSSLVRLDAARGTLLGQWRLDDSRLSMRHLARNGSLLGIALQAEHDDPAARAAAPLLALFDGRGLSIASPQDTLATQGYAGDIAPAGTGFVIGAPRGNLVTRWMPGAGWQTPIALAEGCAIAASNAGGAPIWAAGRGAAMRLQGEEKTRMDLSSSIRVDNHWIVA